MHAFFMGTADHRLFGAYDPPSDGSDLERAVVLCPPWGREYLNSHRSLRQLALILAAAGCHVLRFDWYGTGDSAGEGGDLATWTDDVSIAVDELKALSGVDRTWLVGMRLGAVMVANAVGRRHDIGDVVLWDPVTDGTVYMKECLAMHAEFTKKAAEIQRFSDGTEFLDVLGHVLPASLREEFESIDTAAAMAGWTGRAKVVVSGDRPSYGQFCRRLGEQGVEYDYTVIPGPHAWIEDLELLAGRIPLDLLRCIEDGIR